MPGTRTVVVTLVADWHGGQRMPRGSAGPLPSLMGRLRCPPGTTPQTRTRRRAQDFGERHAHAPLRLVAEGRLIKARVGQPVVVAPPAFHRADHAGRGN